jgi:hypothetical protein
MALERVREVYGDELIKIDEVVHEKVMSERIYHGINVD